MNYETAKQTNRALVGQTLSNTMTLDESNNLDASLEMDQRHEIISIENQNERGRASAKKDY